MKTLLNDVKIPALMIGIVAFVVFITPVLIRIVRWWYVLVLGDLMEGELG